MVHARSRRSFLVFAFAAGLPVCACSSSGGEQNDAGVPTPDGGATITAIQARSNVREAFLAEAQWTRFYAISARTPAESTAFTHLTASENALAAQVGIFAGQQSQAALASLLQQRASYFGALIAPMRAVGVSPESALYANAANIAQFFGRLGPAWSAPDLQKKLDAQLRAQLDGIKQRSQNDNRVSANAFDVADDATLAVADDVTAGIVSQYPNAIAQATTTTTQDDFTLKMRIAVDEHAFWLRVFVVDHMAQVDAQPALDRIAIADTQFGDLYHQYFGDTVGAEAQHAIHTDETDATAFVFALFDLKDQSAVDGTSKLWDADADAFAQFLNTTTPTLALPDMQQTTHTNVDRERTMITSHFAQQWEADASNYEFAVVSWDGLADVVSKAVTTSVAPPK